MTTALFIIDMQQDFFTDHEALRSLRKWLADNINNLVSICRIHHVPVIWIRQEFSEDLSDAFAVMRTNHIHKTIKGTEGCTLLPELSRNEEDYEIIKKRYSPFYRTDLEKLLKDLCADTIILAGINTHACIRMAAVDAYQRDYRIILAEDCVTSYDAEFHHETLRYLTRYMAEILSNEKIRQLLALRN